MHMAGLKSPPMPPTATPAMTAMRRTAPMKSKTAMKAMKAMRAMKAMQSMRATKAVKTMKTMQAKDPVPWWIVEATKAELALVDLVLANSPEKVAEWVGRVRVGRAELAKVW